MRLEGSCRCGSISFSLHSHTPYPYQRCYCSICRKSAGGGGYAINIMGDFATLKITGRRAIRTWHAMIDGKEGSAERSFCRHCGTPLPKPPANVHLLLRDKAPWVEPEIGPKDERYEGYPALSIEDWHKRRGL